MAPLSVGGAVVDDDDLQVLVHVEASRLSRQAGR